MNSGYLHFPEFDPVIFSVGPVSLHWYGLMYLVGFIFAMWLAGRRASRPGSGWTKNEVENLLYAGFLGVFLGGRIGYVLFYNFPVFLNDPLYLFRVWDGGMSFHGGLIGVILVMVIFAKRTKRNFFQVSDFIAPLIPFGLVMYPTLPKSITLMIVLAFAVIQVLVHLVYFLHLDRSKEQRDNVIAFVFAGLVILLLVGLSIWIMFSIHTFMMAK